MLIRAVALWSVLAGAVGVVQPLDVRLEAGAEPGAVVVMIAPWPPSRIERQPDGLRLASSWSRIGNRFLVIVEQHPGIAPGAGLRLLPQVGYRPTAVPALLAGVAAPVPLPLTEPRLAGALSFDLGRRSSTRVVLLRGRQLQDAAILLGTRSLRSHSDSAPGRQVLLVPPGPAGDRLHLVSRSGAELILTEASIHVGYPLPAPEAYQVGPGRDGEFAFEVPLRPGPMNLSFEVFDAIEPGEIQMELEDHDLWINPTRVKVADWSEPFTVELPEAFRAPGRPSLLRVRLRSPSGGLSRSDQGSGVRRLALDARLPIVAPVGGSTDDHPSTLLLSFVAELDGPHRLRFLAAGLSEPEELAVELDGEPLLAVGAEGGVSERSVDIALPGSLTAGERYLVRLHRPLRDREHPGWSVSRLRVDADTPPADVVPTVTPRASGPVVSHAPTGAPSSATLSIAASPPASLPGQASQPIGTTDLFFGVPVLAAELDAAPPVAVASWAVAVDDPRGILVHGPVLAGSPLDRPELGDAQPGQASFLVEPPRELPASVPLAPAVRRPGARLTVQSEPPGAAVFLARTAGYRGEFIGLTPLEINERRTGWARLLMELPGHHPATVPIQLPSHGRVHLQRTLLPWSGLDLSRPVPVGSESALVTSEGYIAPAVADIDRDGRMDLVIGGESGAVRWMRNLPILHDPLFDDPRPLLRTGGRRIEVEGYAVPAVVDWDGDGLVDLLVGDSFGDIYLFLGADRPGVFVPRGLVQADGAPLNVGNGAVPLVVDWNHDSVPDLLVGSGYGVVVLYLGVDGGQLTQVASVTVAGAALQLTLDAIPVDYADWTGDSVPDLAVADIYGNFRLYPGTGATRPDFGSSRRMTHRNGLDLNVGTYPHGLAVDFDGDGYRDLFLGNAAGQLFWLRGGSPGDFDELLPLFDEPPSRPVVEGALFGR